MSFAKFWKSVKPAMDLVQAIESIAPGPATYAPDTLKETSGSAIESALSESSAKGMTPVEDNMTDNTALIYPQDLFQPGNEAYIFFIMRDPNKADEVALKRIGLYMPPAIKVKYHTQWESISMSVQQAGSAASDIGDAFFGNLGTDRQSKGASSIARMATQGAANLASDFVGGGTFGEQAEVIYGRTVDPHMALLFKGVDFRSFQFEFQFLARTAKESESIRQIIKTFKWGMHPGKEGGALWWEYPNVFDIYLLTPSHRYMFNIMQCVLEDMDVDYGGSGAASFFQVTGAPVDIRLSMTFKEVALLDKTKIMGDY